MGTKRLEAKKNKKQQQQDDAAAANGAAVPPDAVAIEMTAVAAAASLPVGDTVARNGSINGTNRAFKFSALPFNPVTLSWRNLKYTVDIPKADKTVEKKVLLKGISGFSKPGTLTALMGSSGAGKTTLMDVIAGRKTVGYIEGDILVNGHPKQDRTFNQLTGYVEQQDLHMGLATVQEAIRFSAKLRLPRTVGDTQRNEWCEEVMKLVGLTKIRARMIGDAANPGLAPGQLKLVTIAVELVANPAVLFLDEPTSGLDAPSAFRVMKAVRRIAATGRSVLCTIHQPSAELFFMFDRLLLLKSGGEVVYFANVGKNGRTLVDYFENVSLRAGTLNDGEESPKLPPGINPANWMLDVIGAGGNAGGEAGSISNSAYAAADYVALWKKSSLSADTDSECELSYIPLDASLLKEAEQLVYVNELTRYWELQKRYFVMHWRNVPTNFTRCLLQSIIGTVMGAIYFDIDTSTFTGVNSQVAVLFIGLMFPSFIVAGAALASFFRQRAVYYRENTIGMYHYFSYLVAMTVVEAPYILFSTFFFLIPYYFMIGFNTSAYYFFRHLLTQFLLGMVYSSLSLLWIAIMPSQMAVDGVNALLMGLFLVFGGLFIRASKIPVGWKWFYYIDPVPKALINNNMLHFYSKPHAMVEVPQEGWVNTYEYISRTLDGGVTDYWPYVGWLILTIFVIKLLNLWGLKKVSWIKR